MHGITDLYIFIIAGLLLNITPGSDMLYILSSAFQKGFKSSIIATLGISTGCLFHVFLAVVGLSAILQSSHTAFLVVKYIGAIYLIYLGITMLLNKNKKVNDSPNLKENSLKKVFWNGVFINALNPKVALFFITFLPQFVDVNSDNKSFILLLLGLIFIFFGTIVNILIAFTALKLTVNLSIGQIFARFIKRIVGILFIGFGIKLALEKF